MFAKTFYLLLSLVLSTLKNDLDNISMQAEVINSNLTMIFSIAVVAISANINSDILIGRNLNNVKQ